MPQRITLDDGTVLTLADDPQQNLMDLYNRAASKNPKGGPRPAPPLGLTNQNPSISETETSSSDPATRRANALQSLLGLGTAAASLPISGSLGAASTLAFPPKTMGEAAGQLAGGAAFQFLPAPIRALLSKTGASPQASRIAADAISGGVGGATTPIVRGLTDQTSIDPLSTLRDASIGAATPLALHSLTTIPATKASKARDIATTKQGILDVSNTVDAQKTAAQAKQDAIDRYERSITVTKTDAKGQILDLKPTIVAHQKAVDAAQQELDDLEKSVGPKMLPRTTIPPGGSGKQVTEMVPNVHAAPAYAAAEAKLTSAQSNLQSVKDQMAGLQRAAAGIPSPRDAAVTSYQKQINYLVKNKEAAYVSLDQINANSRVAQARLNQLTSHLDSFGRPDLAQKINSAVGHYAVRMLPYGIMFHFPTPGMAIKAAGAGVFLGGIVAYDKLVKAITAPGKNSAELSNQFGQWLEKGASIGALKAFPAVQNWLERDMQPVKTNTSQTPAAAQAPPTQ